MAAPRHTATAVISFGLVAIPVKLYTAVSSSSVGFNLLHEKCKSRVRQFYECPTCGEKVARQDLVKGYEYAKEQYVVFTDEELKRLEQAASPTVEILEFVPAASVDPIHFEHSQYLGPDKGGERAYRLLVEALTRSGRAAVARTVSHGKEHVVLIRPREGGLAMHALYLASEVRSAADIGKGEGPAPRPEEIDLAMKLIEHLASERFDPSKYRDTYRERVDAAIQEKVTGQEVAAVPAAEPQAQIIDIMEALKKSLGKAGAA